MALKAWRKDLEIVDYMQHWVAWRSKVLTVLDTLIERVYLFSMDKLVGLTGNINLNSSAN